MLRQTRQLSIGAKQVIMEAALNTVHWQRAKIETMLENGEPNWEVLKQEHILTCYREDYQIALADLRDAQQRQGA